MIYAMRTQNNRTMPRVLPQTKNAAYEPVKDKTLSFTAGNMNGEGPKLISWVQYLCEMFVGHHLQIHTALIKDHKRLTGRESRKIKLLISTYFLLYDAANSKWK